MTEHLKPSAERGKGLRDKKKPEGGKEKSYQLKGEDLLSDEARDSPLRGSSRWDCGQGDRSSFLCVRESKARKKKKKKKTPPPPPPPPPPPQKQKPPQNPPPKTTPPHTPPPPNPPPTPPTNHQKPKPHVVLGFWFLGGVFCGGGQNPPPPPPPQKKTTNVNSYGEAARKRMIQVSRRGKSSFRRGVSIGEIGFWGKEGEGSAMSRGGEIPPGVQQGTFRRNISL